MILSPKDNKIYDNTQSLLVVPNTLENGVEDLRSLERIMEDKGFNPDLKEDQVFSTNKGSPNIENNECLAEYKGIQISPIRNLKRVLESAWDSGGDSLISDLEYYSCEEDNDHDECGL